MQANLNLYGKFEFDVSEFDFDMSEFEFYVAK
jgi:hypothetical protein